MSLLQLQEITINYNNQQHEKRQRNCKGLKQPLTSVELEAQREYRRQYYRKRKANETAEQKEKRRAYAREYFAKRKAAAKHQQQKEQELAIQFAEHSLNNNGNCQQYQKMKADNFNTMQPCRRYSNNNELDAALSSLQLYL